MTRSTRNKTKVNYAKNLDSDEDDFCNAPKKKSNKQSTEVQQEKRGSPVAKRPRLSAEEKYELDLKLAVDRSNQDTGDQTEPCEQQQQQFDEKEEKSEGEKDDDDDSYDGCHGDSESDISSDGCVDSEDDYEVTPKPKAKGKKATAKAGKESQTIKPSGKTAQGKEKTPKNSKKKATTSIPPRSTPHPKPPPSGRPLLPQGGLGGVKLPSQGGSGAVRLSPQGGLGGVKLPSQGGSGAVKLSPQGGLGGVKLSKHGGINGVKLSSQGGLGGVKLSPQVGLGGVKLSPQVGLGGIRVGLSRNARIKPLHQLQTSKH